MTELSEQAHLCTPHKVDWVYEVRFAPSGPRLVVYHTAKLPPGGEASWEPPYDFALSDLPNDQITAADLEKLGFFKVLVEADTVLSLEIGYTPGLPTHAVRVVGS